MDTDNKLLRV